MLAQLTASNGPCNTSDGTILERVLPARHGLPWGVEDDFLLKLLMERGYPLWKLADALMRTQESVLHRIELQSPVKAVERERRNRRAANPDAGLARHPRGPRRTFEARAPQRCRVCRLMVGAGDMAHYIGKRTFAHATCS